MFLLFFGVIPRLARIKLSPSKLQRVQAIETEMADVERKQLADESIFICATTKDKRRKNPFPNFETYQ